MLLGNLEFRKTKSFKDFDLEKFVSKVINRERVSGLGVTVTK